jgi:DNA-binding NarL/FixJ family response regulator
MLLKQEPGVNVVGTVSEAESLLALVKTTRPDLVFLDWELPGDQAIAEIVSSLQKLDLRPKIIAPQQSTGSRANRTGRWRRRFY